MKNHEPTRRGCGESHRSLQSQPGFFSPNGAAIPPARANGPGTESRNNSQPQGGYRSSAVVEAFVPTNDRPVGAERSVVNHLPGPMARAG